MCLNLFRPPCGVRRRRVLHEEYPAIHKIYHGETRRGRSLQISFCLFVIYF